MSTRFVPSSALARHSIILFPDIPSPFVFLWHQFSALDQKLDHQATHLHNIVHNIFPQLPVYLLSGFLIRTRLCGVCLCTCYKVIIRMRRNMVYKPCVEHEEPDSSSESILVLSSSFLLVRILDGTQTNCVDHKKTTGVWGRGPDPGYVPSEVRWVEGVQAGMETGKDIPCDKHDRIHLSPISKRRYQRPKKLISPSSLTFTSQYMFCSSFQCKSKCIYQGHEDGQV